MVALITFSKIESVIRFATVALVGWLARDLRVRLLRLCLVYLQTGFLFLFWFEGPLFHFTLPKRVTQGRSLRLTR